MQASHSSDDVKQKELEQWLSSKLTSDWVSERMASHLNEDVLAFFASRNSAGLPRFKLMENNLKLKLLVSILAARKKQLTELSHHFLTIFDVCLKIFCKFY